MKIKYRSLVTFSILTGIASFIGLVYSAGWLTTGCIFWLLWANNIQQRIK